MHTKGYLLAVNQHVSVTTSHDIEEVTVISLSDDVGAGVDGERLHDIHNVLDGLWLQVIEHVMFLDNKTIDSQDSWYIMYDKRSMCIKREYKGI